MRSLIVFESMFGNTRQIAEAIATGLGGAEVRGVGEVTAADLAVDLVVVGGPTHVHSLSRFATRKAAREQADDPKQNVRMDAKADMRVGVREWLATVDLAGRAAAAFDTRLDAPMMFTGHASKGIAKRLGQAGAEVIVPPMSFVVTKQNELVAGELDRAVAFGRELAERASVRQVA